jgi:hypothetical protein
MIVFLASARGRAALAGAAISYLNKTSGLNLENELILLIIPDFRLPKIAPQANPRDDRRLPRSRLRDLDHGVGRRSALHESAVIG